MTASPARHRARVTVAAALLGTVCVTGPARAEIRVSIQYDSEQKLELARRLQSELESEGYTVELKAGNEPSACDARGATAVTAPRDAQAWIQVGGGTTEGESSVASICFLGSLPFLQEATATAPPSEPGQLAVATAEALNGLRSKLPPVVAGAAAPERRETPPDAPAALPHARSLENSVALGAALLLNAPDYPAAPGLVLQTTAGSSSGLGLALDAFVPTTGAELASPQVAATLRTAWLRVGPRFSWEAGDFKLAGALLAGAALSWATAVAEPPRVGTAAVAPSAVLSLAAAVEYPARSTVFARLSGSASALVPGLRLELGDGASAPRGSWPLEAAIALGARWGGER